MERCYRTHSLMLFCDVRLIKNLARSTEHAVLNAKLAAHLIKKGALYKTCSVERKTCSGPQSKMSTGGSNAGFEASFA